MRRNDSPRRGSSPDRIRARSDRALQSLQPVETYTDGDGDVIRFFIQALGSQTQGMTLKELHRNFHRAGIWHSQLAKDLRPTEIPAHWNTTATDTIQPGDIIEANFPEKLQDENSYPPGHLARADSARETFLTAPHQAVVVKRGSLITEDEVLDIAMCGSSKGTALKRAGKIVVEDVDAVALILHRDSPLPPHLPAGLKVIRVNSLSGWPYKDCTIVDVRHRTYIRTNAPMGVVGQILDSERDKLGDMLTVQDEKTAVNLKKGRFNDGTLLSAPSDEGGDAQAKLEDQLSRIQQLIVAYQQEFGALPTHVVRQLMDDRSSPQRTTGKQEPEDDRQVEDTEGGAVDPEGQPKAKDNTSPDKSQQQPPSLPQAATQATFGSLYDKTGRFNIGDQVQHQIVTTITRETDPRRRPREPYQEVASANSSADAIAAVANNATSRPVGSLLRQTVTRLPDKGSTNAPSGGSYKISLPGPGDPRGRLSSQRKDVSKVENPEKL